MKKSEYVLKYPGTDDEVRIGDSVAIRKFRLIERGDKQKYALKSDEKIF